MKRPLEWKPKQLALATYAHLYGIEDLGIPLDEVLHLAGLTSGQWQTRITIDFPAQDGTSKFMPRIDTWYEEYNRQKQMPQPDLRQMCLRYLENMRERKGLAGRGPGPL